MKACHILHSKDPKSENSEVLGKTGEYIAVNRPSLRPAAQPGRGGAVTMS
jgi:hypothetical protein